MSSAHWQAVAAGVTVALLLVAALIATERRIAHVEDRLLAREEVVDLYSRLAVLEYRLEIR